MTLPFYTVGHSTRTLLEFVELLRAAEVARVVDVRTVPRSRTNPLYNQDSLPENLAPYQIEYKLISELGGLRKKSQEIPPNLNGLWENQSFHNYADYALSDSFQAGLKQLIASGRQQRCVIMCAEAVWWRCHRRIIADYLIARGEDVFHLMGKDKIEAATMTKGSQVNAKGQVIYSA